MAEINPPLALQNAGATHTAAMHRLSMGALLAGRSGAGSLIPRGGVNPTLGGALRVTAQGTPSMAVDVASGVGFVPGTESPSQGTYVCTNDLTKVVTVTAAHGSLPRIDRIIARVRDSSYSGATDAWALEVLTGTAAASPVAPSLPANSISLARISVAALATTITSGNITSERDFIASNGGVISCLSTDRPVVTTEVDNSQIIYETDTGRFYGLASGTYSLLSRYEQTILVSSPVASVTFSSIPSTFKVVTLHWTVRTTDPGFMAQTLHMRINGGSTGSTYRTQNLQVSGTSSPSAGIFVGATDGNKAHIGLTASSGANAGVFGTGNVVFNSWNNPHTNYLGWQYEAFLANSDTSTQIWETRGSGIFTGNGPYTSLTVLTSLGNFSAGSQFVLIGHI